MAGVGGRGTWTQETVADLSTIDCRVRGSRVTAAASVLCRDHTCDDLLVRAVATWPAQLCAGDESHRAGDGVMVRPPPSISQI